MPTSPIQRRRPPEEGPISLAPVKLKLGNLFISVGLSGTGTTGPDNPDISIGLKSPIIFEFSVSNRGLIIPKFRAGFLDRDLSYLSCCFAMSNFSAINLSFMAVVLWRYIPGNIGRGSL